VSPRCANLHFPKTTALLRQELVDWPSPDPAGKDDPGLKGAVVGHEHIEPVRWKKPNVLILQRHDYYRSPRSDGAITDLGRLWETTVTFAADGKPDVKWKLDGRW